MSTQKRKEKQNVPRKGYKAPYGYKKAWMPLAFLLNFSSLVLLTMNQGNILLAAAVVREILLAFITISIVMYGGSAGMTIRTHTSYIL